MRHFLTVPVLLLASALWGCAALSEPAERLQTTLRTHPDPAFNELFVTESNGVLRIGGFVNSLKQKIRCPVLPTVKHGSTDGMPESDRAFITNNS